MCDPSRFVDELDSVDDDGYTPPSASNALMCVVETVSIITGRCWHDLIDIYISFEEVWVRTRKSRLA